MNALLEQLVGLKNTFLGGDERSTLIKKNAIMSLLFQGINVAVQMLLVPLTLNYLDPLKFGIWMTLNVAINWLFFFDLGFANGLKNKLAESIALGDNRSVRDYLGSAYIFFLILGSCMALIAVLVLFFIDPAALFNAPRHLHAELFLMMTFATGCFLLRFALSPIQTLLSADQRNAVNNALQTLANLSSLLLVYYLVSTTASSLPRMALAISAPLPFILLCASFYLFKKQYRVLRPSFDNLSLGLVYPLLKLGGGFFILQVVSVVIYTSDNMIIAQVLGPEAVTDYALVHKYFGFVSLLFSIAATPIWSAFTHAWAKGDMKWISSTLVKLQKLWILIAILCFALVFFANRLIGFWIGHPVNMPVLLILLMALFVVQNTWIIIYAYCVNGIGVIRLQVLIQVFAGGANIPLAVLFAGSLRMGSSGVILATIVCLIPQMVFLPMQCRKILNGTAHGLWLK